MTEDGGGGASWSLASARVLRDALVAKTARCVATLHLSPGPSPNLTLPFKMDTHLPPSHPQYRIIQANEFDVAETLSSRNTGGWKGTSWKPERELDQNMDVSKTAMQRAAERFPGRPMQIHAQVAKGWTYVELDRR